MKWISKYKRLSILSALFVLISYSIPVYAYVGDAYVTPDSWSRHLSAYGVKSSINGLDFGDSGTLKIGLTTRAQLRYADEDDWSIYQYAKLRLGGSKVGDGVINMNINVRGAYDDMPVIGDNKYHQFYDGLYTARKYNEFTRSSENMDGDFRIYQANIELNKVIPLTDVSLGRIYLTAFNGYKIDGVNIKIDPVKYLNLNLYYGLPVSYYSNLKTQVAGVSFEIPVEQSGTKIRGEYSYFMHEDGGDLNTHVLHGRIDQSLNFTDILNASIYAEGAVIGKAMVYDIGLEANIDKSKTGISAYVMGQYDKNDGAINPYVSMYESLLSGEREYVMGGVMITQGITDYLMLGVGYEGRFNFNEAYGDRDYHRVFGNIDLVGLIHRNNYLSLIVDYYKVAQYQRLDENAQIMGGFRMTQVFTDKIEAWIGVNVQNYQYHRSPVKLYQWETLGQITNQNLLNENITVAYIGGMWQVTDWCVLQLDYTFEYADLFKAQDMQPESHTVEMWANFLW